MTKLFLVDCLWRVSGEESYPDHYGEFLESFLETIRVFLEIGEKIGYPQMSGESNCLLAGYFDFSAKS